jgi:putative ABC transport system substrate-binding protein
MRRREFITLIGGAVASSMLGTRAARAQEPARLRRVGIILGGSRTPPIDGFLQGMGELGYVAGRDYVAEWRFADGRYTRFPDFAQDFVRLKVDAIFLGTAAAVEGVRQVTNTIPIVMGYSIDPVRNRLIASLTRPGANITGMAGSTEDSSPKQLALLQAVVPSLARVGVLLNPESSDYSDVSTKLQAAAARAMLALVRVDARNPQGIDRAFTDFAGERVEAVLVTDDAHFFAQQERVAALALKHRLPSIYPERDYVRAGGLMSYGESLKEGYRRAASFVDRIFKGAKAAELPIEPVPRQWVINRKTAAVLGLTIPPEVYAAADEVID